MKYFITGVTGQLGYDIVRELEKRGEHNFLAPTEKELDITVEDAVVKAVKDYQPDVIFHCAAYTAVDRAEEEQEKAYQVNVIGTKNMLLASKAVDAKLVYISTDYVFDGKKDGEYVPDDIPAPQSVYGKTKWQGEEEVRKNKKHFITRVSWVFGKNGNNFIKTMLNLAKTHSSLNVVCDQIGSPTYTVDLAKLLVDLVQTEKYGTYHVTNEGFCSWQEFAEAIFAFTEKKVKVNPVTTEKYAKLINANQATRPKNSKMSKQKLVENGFCLLPTWQDALSRFLEEIKEVD